MICHLFFYMLFLFARKKIKEMETGRRAGNWSFLVAAFLQSSHSSAYFSSKNSLYCPRRVLRYSCTFYHKILSALLCAFITVCVLDLKHLGASTRCDLEIIPHKVLLRLSALLYGGYEIKQNKKRHLFPTSFK